jgi:hypothetical protein
VIRFRQCQLAGGLATVYSILVIRSRQCQLAGSLTTLLYSRPCSMQSYNGIGAYLLWALRHTHWQQSRRARTGAWCSKIHLGKGDQ